MSERVREIWVIKMVDMWKISSLYFLWDYFECFHKRSRRTLMSHHSTGILSFHVSASPDFMACKINVYYYYYYYYYYLLCLFTSYICLLKHNISPAQTWSSGLWIVVSLCETIGCSENNGCCCCQPSLFDTLSIPNKFGCCCQLSSFDTLSIPNKFGCCCCSLKLNIRPFWKPKSPWRLLGPDSFEKTERHRSCSRHHRSGAHHIFRRHPQETWLPYTLRNMVPHDRTLVLRWSVTESCKQMEIIILVLIDQEL